MECWLKVAKTKVSEQCAAEDDVKMDEDVMRLLDTVKISQDEDGGRNITTVCNVDHRTDRTSDDGSQRSKLGSEKGSDGMNPITDNGDDTTNSPISIPPPVVSPTPCLDLIGNEAKVYFDLETGGLSRDVDILQISAICGGQMFDKYVTPLGKIQRQASIVTGIWCRRGVMCVNGRRVSSVPVAIALGQFTNWLRRIRPCILIAHNSKFDSQHLLHHLCDQNLEKQFAECVAGFVDSIPIFKSYYPKMPDYKQTTLVTAVLNKKYAAHNALADVRALKCLMESIQVTRKDLIQHGYSMTWAIRETKLRQNRDENSKSLQPLVEQHFLSAAMANKIAQSGLHLRHLETLHNSGSVDELHAVFSAHTDNGGVRVSKCRRISEKLCLYFQSLENSPK